MLSGKWDSPAHSFEMTVTGGLRSLALCQEVEPYLRNYRQFHISISGPESWVNSLLNNKPCKPEGWTYADRGRRTQPWNGMPAAEEESGWTLIHEEYTTYYEWVRRVETFFKQMGNYLLTNKTEKLNYETVEEKGVSLSNLYPSLCKVRKIHTQHHVLSQVMVLENTCSDVKNKQKKYLRK